MYKFTKSQKKIYHLMCLDDIKIFAKNKIKKLKTLIQRIRIYSQDIGMEFEKCAMLIIKSEKRETTEGTELLNQESIRIFEEKENYKLLRNIGSGHHQTNRDERKIRKEYFRNRNRIKEINTCAVPLVRYSEPFLKWTRKEFRQMDQRIRKQKTMHKALHPTNNRNKLYVSRKEEGRGLASIEDCVDASI